jgi:hypothetical protein
MGTHLAALISVVGFVILFVYGSALDSVEGPRDTGLVGGSALIGLAILIWPICSGPPNLFIIIKKTARPEHTRSECTRDGHAKRLTFRSRSD